MNKILSSHIKIFKENKNNIVQELILEKEFQEWTKEVSPKLFDKDYYQFLIDSIFYLNLKRKKLKRKKR
jgi:hypothetical protein